MSYWVVDANIAVQSALNISDSLEHFWERVNQEQITPCSPRLWMSETTSAVRSLLAQKQITAGEAEQALQTMHALKIEMINEDELLCLHALALAAKLGQSKAYDAFYLALAERLETEFWTMDERLANRCKDLRLEWVHWIGEM